MQSSSFAPLLSATLSPVSCWTNLFGLLHDFDHAPALLLGKRSRLHDPDQVADAADVLLVVRLETHPALDGLLVKGVLGEVGDLHDDRLLHLVRDHVPGPRLARAPGFDSCCLAHFFSSSSGSSCDVPGDSEVPGDSSSSGDVPGDSSSSSSVSVSVSAATRAVLAALAAALPSTIGADGASSSSRSRPSSRWRRKVRIRAMSWRTLGICRWSSSWPTASLKRSS